MSIYNTPLEERFGEKLEELREGKNMTREQLADQVGLMAEQLRISSRAYSDLERGKYAASAPTLLFLFSMLEADAQRVLIQQFMKQVQALEGTDAA